MTLKEFIDSDYRNLHIYEEGLMAYVRISLRSIDGQYYKFLDIASVEVETHLQNKGYFTKFIDHIITSYPDVNIYVESILNDIIIHVLNKFHFKDHSSGEFDRNMYLIR